MEQWKAIEGTNGMIQVSNEGNVRSLLRGTPFMLKTTPDRKGYRRLRVTIKRRKMSFKLHREVAKAFIPNPNDLPQVNHIDGDKNNNSVNNLEWVTNQENANHAIRTGLWETVTAGAKAEDEKRKKPVVATNGTESIHFESVREAERHFNSRHITAVLKGKRGHVKGWTFFYE